MNPAIHHAARPVIEAAYPHATRPWLAPPARRAGDRATVEPPAAHTSANLAERVAAQLGAWLGEFSERWLPARGPFFVSDGQLAAACAAFNTPRADRRGYQHQSVGAFSEHRLTPEPPSLARGPNEPLP